MKRVLVACCSDRDLRGDYNIAWSVVLHRGQDGVRAQMCWMEGSRGHFWSSPALCVMTPLSLQVCPTAVSWGLKFHH